MKRVITEIRIEGLRGIRSGVVSGLTELSVLVGPNNAGKSTVLDALLIGGHPVPGDAIARVLQRRAVERGLRWLFWRNERVASVTVKTRLDVERRCALTGGSNLALASIMVEVTTPAGDWKLGLRLLEDGTFGAQNGAVGALDEVPAVDLVEPHRGFPQEPLYRVYTRAMEEGRIDQVDGLLRELLIGFKRVEILAAEDKPVVYVSYTGGSIPAALQGDGVQSLMRLALELAAAPGGTVLIEEPESAQHPRALFESARAIVLAVKRGVQVVLSTHSLDLIDNLRALLGEDLDKLSVHHLACPEGELSTTRYSGADVALARDAIGEDLR